MLGYPDFHPDFSLAVCLFCATKALVSDHLCCLPAGFVSELHPRVSLGDHLRIDLRIAALWFICCI